MINELKKNEFHRIRGLLRQEADNVEVKAIIDGINPGWVFVDDPIKPSIAMVWSAGQEGFYFVGDTQAQAFLQDLNAYIDQNLRDRALGQGLNRFEFSGDTKGWDSVFHDLFDHRGLTVSDQFIYKLKADQWKTYLKRVNTSPYRVVAIDRDLLSRKDLVNKAFLTQEILRWWSSIDDFLDKSHGYCMLDGHTVTNYSMGNFYVDQVMTIGIETLEAYRRQGLSQVTSELFVDRCLQEGMTVQWECMGENIASYRLAEKMGFVRTMTYTLYSFPF